MKLFPCCFEEDYKNVALKVSVGTQNVEFGVTDKKGVAGSACLRVEELKELKVIIEEAIEAFGK